MAEAKKDVKVIKVQPYPIACLLSKGEGAAPASPAAVPNAAKEVLIQRLEDFGFVCKAVGHFFRIGEDYICDFELPVSKERITQAIKIVKTRESVEPYRLDLKVEEKKQKMMIVEVNFKAQTGDFKQIIRNFLFKIKQQSIKPATIK